MLIVKKPGEKLQSDTHPCRCGMKIAVVLGNPASQREHDRFQRKHDRFQHEHDRSQHEQVSADKIEGSFCRGSGWSRAARAGS